MNVTIELPRLIGTRDAARRLLDQFEIAENLVGVGVEVDARQLITSTVSFADALLVELSERGASDIVIVNAPDDFVGFIQNSIAAHNYTNVSVAQFADVR